VNAALRGSQGESAPVKQEARVADPAAAGALRATALEQLNRGAVDEAVANLKRAVELDPTNNLIKQDLARATRIQSAVQARAS
jgi:Flp pilus assembly protein TadD